MSIRTTLNPGMYHGWGKKPPFFEGWYFKLVSADGKQKVAIIPGVILGKDAHAFIQVLEGVSGKTAYHTFPLETFQADPRKFVFLVGQQLLRSARVEPEYRKRGGGNLRTDPFWTLKPLAGDFALPGDHGLVCLGAAHGVLPRRAQFRSSPRRGIGSRWAAHGFQRRARLH